MHPIKLYARNKMHTEQLTDTELISKLKTAREDIGAQLG